LAEAGRGLGEAEGPVLGEASGALRAAGGSLGEAGPVLGEAEGLALLGDWGVPVVAAEVAGGLEEALAAAGRVGWPVALKTAAPGVVHKSDVNGVRLGLDGPERLAAALAGPGVELALGVVADPQFGPLVMVAAGGVLVEVLRDRRFALPPVDHRQALALLDRLAVRPLLDGVRGAPRPTWTPSPTPSPASPLWPSTSAPPWPPSTSTP
jgi:acyl-CoA synthetase (NDP forming)